MNTPTINEIEALEVIFEGLAGKLSHDNTHRFPADIITDTVFYDLHSNEEVLPEWAQLWGLKPRYAVEEIT